jgi:hypothetical protein
MIKKITALTSFVLFSVHIACSSSIQLSSGNRAGKVAVKSNPNPYGDLEYYRTLKKYDIRPNDPDALRYDAIESIPQRRSSRSNLRCRNSTMEKESATLVQRNAYGSAITIGEGKDAKTFNVQFDTGSGDFWVYSSLFLEPKQLTANFSHTIYDPLNSTTAIPSGQVFSIEYGGGNVSGVVFEDTVTVAGFELKNQLVEAAMITDHKLNPDHSELDGIFGLYPLGNTTIFPGNNTMVLEDLFFGDGSPNEKVFTALLTRPGEGDGFFTFGFIDEQIVGNNTINFSPLLPPISDMDPPFWRVSTPFAVINDERIETKNQSVIIDTGTTLIFLPDKILEIIYQPVGGYFNETLQLWIFPDNINESQLPLINLPVDGFDVYLNRTDIFFDSQSIPGFVIGSYQSSGPDLGDIGIYGDVWLRNVYAIFDLGSGDGSDFRFGFVPRKAGEV